MPIEKFEKYSEVFVETGSYNGDGTQRAIDAGYSRIITIEIMEKRYRACKTRFLLNKNVQLFHGDSSDILEGIISKINEPITFWLDGHFSEGDRLAGVPMKTLCPLMEELEIINRHPIKTHTILIDDMNCWKGFDDIYHSGFDIDTIRRKLHEINPRYNISFINGRQEDGTLMPNDILKAKI